MKNNKTIYSDDLKTVFELEKEYIIAKMNYYRFVIRNEDKSVLKKLIKIPDKWDNYQTTEGIILNDQMKMRLSDIKNRMSWELKMQSLYFYYITNIENVFLSVLQQNSVDQIEIDDAVNSANSLILELDESLVNIKHLLMTLAKRSISDFFYLSSTYSKFFLKKSFNFEFDFSNILELVIQIINKQSIVDKNVDMFIRYEREISPLFEKSSNSLGWRMNEFAVKEYLDKGNHAMKILDFNRVVKDAYAYRKILHEYYSFLNHYYNESDGKMFRLNFIHDSLKAKLEKGIIESEVYNSFEAIRDSFKAYKYQFEFEGISGFGSQKMSYRELIHFIYKLCKIIEFYYLRNMKYENLRVFRNDLLFYIEKEILNFN